MKRIALHISVIILMLVFLVSGSGLFFNIHECRTKHISRITFTPGESCCKTAKEFKSFNKDIFLPACCVHKTKNAFSKANNPIKSCCTDKPVYLKVKSKYLNFANYILKADNGSSLTLQTGILTSLVKFDKPLSLLFFTNGPPGRIDKPNIFVLNHQFLV
jgi:hypothetical protein